MEENVTTNFAEADAEYTKIQANRDFSDPFEYQYVSQSDLKKIEDAFRKSSSSSSRSDNTRYTQTAEGPQQQKDPEQKTTKRSESHKPSHKSEFLEVNDEDPARIRFLKNLYNASVKIGNYHPSHYTEVELAMLRFMTAIVPAFATSFIRGYMDAGRAREARAEQLINERQDKVAGGFSSVEDLRHLVGQLEPAFSSKDGDYGMKNAEILMREGFRMNLRSAYSDMSPGDVEEAVSVLMKDMRHKVVPHLKAKVTFLEDSLHNKAISEESAKKQLAEVMDYYYKAISPESMKARLDAYRWESHKNRDIVTKLKGLAPLSQMLALSPNDPNVKQYYSELLDEHFNTAEMPVGHKAYFYSVYKPALEHELSQLFISDLPPRELAQQVAKALSPTRFTERLLVLGQTNFELGALSQAQKDKAIEDFIAGKNTEHANQIENLFKSAFGTQLYQNLKPSIKKDSSLVKSALNRSNGNFVKDVINATWGAASSHTRKLLNDEQTKLRSRYQAKNIDSIHRVLLLGLDDKETISKLTEKFLALGLTANMKAAEQAALMIHERFKRLDLKDISNPEVSAALKHVTETLFTQGIKEEIKNQHMSTREHEQDVVRNKELSQTQRTQSASRRS